MSLVLDAGALIAIDRDVRTTIRRVKLAERTGERVVTSAAVVAQVWRNGSRQANLARMLVGITSVGLHGEEARKLGTLLAASRTNDVVDAHVASLVNLGDQVLTSDPEDITHLLRIRRINADIRTV